VKICVTGKEADPESAVDARFGRASVLLVVDTEEHEIRPLGGVTDAPHGAGVRAAQAVIGAGARAVITGEVGPKAFGVLQAAEVPIYRAAGMTVADAIEAFAQGRLEPITRAGGQPHADPV
jgi:predicted Fe-Mo cluster-binding NifX family protein